MRPVSRGLIPAALAGSFCLLGPVGARADEPAAAPRVYSKAKADTKVKAAPTKAELDAQAEPIDLLEGLRTRALKAEAEGTGDGSMAVAITNRTRKPLRVVLPPGLIAAGATGQFGGGMGGMGGGMGGMGGGMGGMGGGMGGMGGGGMGGGGMGGGGMGGQQGGGGMGGQQGGGTLPASSGMMSLSFIIMTLVEPGTWDMRSPMIGMMMMMGGGGMGGGMGGGGMGGGMGGGGMGGGMMGGMGGMRSVAEAGPPQAVIRAGQSRRLLTRLVSLEAPQADARVAMPPKGERLKLMGVAQGSDDPRVRAALTGLAAEHAPANLAQLVMWRVADKLPWETIAQSAPWANEHELALARRFVARLDADAKGSGDETALHVAVTGPGAEVLAATLADQVMLGLKARAGVPERPEGPALACRVHLAPGARGDATVTVLASDSAGSAWEPQGKFTLPVARDEAGKLKPAAVADALAEGVLNRLVRVQVTRATREPARGKLAYRVRIDNDSPLLLHGLAVAGAGKKAPEGVALGMMNLSVAPRRATNLAVTAEMVDRLGLKGGAHAVAADLGGL